MEFKDKKNQQLVIFDDGDTGGETVILHRNKSEYVAKLAIKDKTDGTYALTTLSPGAELANFIATLMHLQHECKLPTRDEDIVKYRAILSEM